MPIFASKILSLHKRFCQLAYLHILFPPKSLSHQAQPSRPRKPIGIPRHNHLVFNTLQYGPFGVAEWAVLNGHTARFEMRYGPFGRTLPPT